MEQRKDKRTLYALRKHIDGLLVDGAVITGRDPVTIVSAGETMRVQHGMLISYTGLAEMIKPFSDHEWPNALRQMASDMCTKQLEQTIEALERSNLMAKLDPGAISDGVTLRNV